MTSNRRRSESTNFAASIPANSICRAPSFCKLAFNACNTSRFDSTMTTSAAPRDAASNPIAPLPANRSRHRLVRMSCPSQLNTVSRTRSGVGRRSVWSGKVRTRLRHSPPMMRTLFLTSGRTKIKTYGIRIPRFTKNRFFIFYFVSCAPTTTVTIPEGLMRR